MKYQIIEKPVDAVRPVIRLKPGEKGKIKEVYILFKDDIFGKDSLIKTKIGGDGFTTSILGTYKDALASFAKPFSGKPIAEFEDEELKYASQKLKLPINELKEIRDLEREYRDKVDSADKYLGQ